jgi:hypothetical protein
MGFKSTYFWSLTTSRVTSILENESINVSENCLIKNECGRWNNSHVFFDFFLVEINQLVNFNHI